MNLEKYFPVLILALCMLVACNKKQSENAAQSSQDTQAAQSAQETPAGTPGQSPQTAPAQPATSQAPPVAAVPPPPPAPKPIVIPAGTVLTVRLQQALSSKTNSQGDPFNATLATPVTVNGKTVVPAGSTVSGSVTEAHKAGRFKGGATLDLVLNSVTIRGSVYQLSTMTMAQTSKGKGKRTAVMTGGGAGAGALIGGLAGGGKGAAIGALAGAGAGVAGSAFTGNRDIDMPAESSVSFQMTNSLKLPPPSGSASDDSQQ
jgi:hypothetical protein